MVKKYIIMCGGNYKHWETPRHLSVINGEELVARTIRLLRENGIQDISISTNNPVFEKFGIPILKHNNSYSMEWHNMEGNWYDAFYPTNEPVCYVLGDVFFSEEAIKKIVETETDDIELFGSIPPFANNYIKKHIEAFALKIENVKHFKDALKKTKELDKQGKFWKKPIIWEIWTVIKDMPLQTKQDEYVYNYTKINDYTCDIDWKEDIRKLENIIEGGIDMIKVEVIKEFTLNDFDKILNLQRSSSKNKEGSLFVGDTFCCSKDMVDYLTGNNAKGIAVVKVIEVVPVKETPKVEVLTDNEEPIKEVKPKTSKKKKKK